MFTQIMHVEKNSYIHNVACRWLQWVTKHVEIGAALHSVCGTIVWVLEQLKERGQRSCDQHAVTCGYVIDLYTV